MPRHFWWFQLVEAGVPGIQWGGAKDAAKPTARRRTTPMHNKELSAKMSVVLELRWEGTAGFTW